MTKLIKKTILAAPIAVIATLGFTTAAFAAVPITLDSAPAYHQKLAVIDVIAPEYGEAIAYKTVNYNYKRRRSHYKSQHRHNSYNPYYKSKPVYSEPVYSKPAYYGKGYTYGYKPSYKSKFKSFGHKKSFRKGFKSKFHYKY